MTLTGFIKIIRPADCIIAAAGTFIVFTLSIQEIQLTAKLFYAMLSVFFICGGGQAINDFLDYEIDKKTSKDKPLTKGTITKNQALIYSMVLFAIGLFFSAKVSSTAATAAVFFVLLLIFYSSLMKSLKFLGNFVVSFSVAFTILFGAIISMNFYLPFILFLAAFFANTAREIIKDLEDKETEEGIKISLPQLISKKAVNSIIVFFYSLAIIIGFYPLLKGLFHSIIYLILMILSIIFFWFSSAQLKKENYSSSQNYSKTGMLFGLLAFLFGVI